MAGGGARGWLGVAGLAAAALAAIALADLPLALALGRDSSPPALDGFVRLADLVTLHGLVGALPGALLLVAAGLAALLGRRRSAARRLAFAGSAILASTVIADLAKPPFGRMRPFQALGGGLDRWFAGAQYSSFPSGHVAFYAAVSLAVLALLPRHWPLAARALALIPALAVAAQRVLSLDHYLGDALAGAALGGACALAAQRLWRPDGIGSKT